jgi:hypothetical protein
LSDLESAGSTITKPRRASVAQIVEMKIFDASLTQSTCECLLNVSQRLKSLAVDKMKVGPCSILAKGSAR